MPRADGAPGGIPHREGHGLAAVRSAVHMGRRARNVAAAGFPRVATAVRGADGALLFAARAGGGTRARPWRSGALGLPLMGDEADGGGERQALLSVPARHRADDDEAAAGPEARGVVVAVAVDIGVLLERVPQARPAVRRCGK